MTRHRFHGASERFDVVADFVADRFPQVRYAADVGGGQGMLARILRKRHGIECEVIDPRGWTLKGVPGRPEPYRADMADFYDLVIGLHPDEALRDVVQSASVRPVLVIPCCNFWTTEERLGRDQLTAAIRGYHLAAGGAAETVSLGFSGPKNQGLVLTPPVATG